MNITLLSPYHGGSHLAWAEGYRRYSGHRVTLLTLPARFWKWRMHGGAVTLARAFLARGERPDLLLATDMVDLTTFVALTRPYLDHTPLCLYMHENQLTYPLSSDGRDGPMRRQQGERDLHYAFINYTSMLAADRIFFNSTYHQESFLAALPGLLKHFPDYNELETVAQLQAKSERLAVGIDLARFQPALPGQAATEEAPLILWNQRWEYDKNPRPFFEALYQLVDQGIAFRLALCGANFRQRPSEFTEALDRLHPYIIHSGYANDALYRQLLWQAEVTLSTAVHEFFGISILEAIYCHTFPILPARLSYPELLPEPYHHRCLYHNQAGLSQRLHWALTQRPEAQRLAAELARSVAIYDWGEMTAVYDTRLSRAHLDYRVPAVKL
jgi:glycosyltransferase involved in cell wall biosynthesis